MSIDTDLDLKQEQEANYRVFDFAGSHYDAGFYLGSNTELRVLRKWGHREPSQAFAEGCVEAVNRYHPDIMDEFAGFAAAHQASLEDLLPHVSLNLPYGEAGACSAFACKTTDGHTIIGRNYDFFYRQQMRHILRYAPQGYYASIGTNSGLVGGRYEGVNERGVFISMHSVMANRPKSAPPGIAFHLVLRIALETCATAKEAARFMQDIPHLDSFNYAMVDSKNMYEVEAYPGLVKVFERNKYLAVTNHYKDRELRVLQGRRDLSNSENRMAVLDKYAADSGPDNFTRNGLENALQDHTAPMCGHRDGIATLWSCICDLTGHTIAYSLGAPCRNEYREIAWPGNKGDYVPHCGCMTRS